MPTRSLSPHSRPFGPHTYTKMKVEYLPGGELHPNQKPTRVSLNLWQWKVGETYREVWVCRLNPRRRRREEELTMFCALSQNHQPLFVCLFVFWGGISSKYVWCKQWRHQRDTRGTPRRDLFLHPHLPHLRRKWHKWAIFVNFFGFLPPIETHFPPQCRPPKKIWCHVATGWSKFWVRDFLHAQSLCVFPVPWLSVILLPYYLIWWVKIIGYKPFKTPYACFFQ